MKLCTDCQHYNIKFFMFNNLVSGTCSRRQKTVSHINGRDLIQYLDAEKERSRKIFGCGKNARYFKQAYSDNYIQAKRIVKFCEEMNINSFDFAEHWAISGKEAKQLSVETTFSLPEINRLFGRKQCQNQ